MTDFFLKLKHQQQMRLTLLFTVTIFLFLSSCKVDKQCVTPTCPPTDLDQLLSLELDFCQTEDTEQCFSKEDLGQVVVLSKYTEDHSTVSIDSLINLANFNNLITIGKGDIPLITNSFNLKSIDLYFEVVVPKTGHRFKVTDIEIVDINRDNPCECYQYEIVSLQLNEETIEINAPIAKLSLKK